MLSDNDGVVLEARSLAGDRELFDRVGLTPGGVWSESREGTNGIGTCLIEGRPVTIHFHRWLREQRSFPSLDALKAQLQRDLAQVRELHDMRMLAAG